MENNMSVAMANLEPKLLDGFSNFKDEVINLKDVIIRNLQEEIAKLRSGADVLENKFNDLKQYGRRNNIELSRIPDLTGDNELECSVIKTMKAIDIEVGDRDIEACHRIGKSKGTQRKQLSVFATVNSVKRPFVTRRNQRLSTHQQLVWEMALNFLSARTWRTIMINWPLNVEKSKGFLLF